MTDRFRGQWQLRPCVASAREQELHRVDLGNAFDHVVGIAGKRERPERDHLFLAETEGLATRGQNRELRAPGEERGDEVGDRVEHLLTVVDRDQHPA